MSRNTRGTNKGFNNYSRGSSRSLRLKFDWCRNGTFRWTKITRGGTSRWGRRRNSADNHIGRRGKTGEKLLTRSTTGSRLTSSLFSTSHSGGEEREEKEEKKSRMKNEDYS